MNMSYAFPCQQIDNIVLFIKKVEVLNLTQFFLFVTSEFWTRWTDFNDSFQFGSVLTVAIVSEYLMNYTYSLFPPVSPDWVSLALLPPDKLT